MKKLLLVFLLLCCSCESSDTNDIGERTDDITYFRDPKSELCFASVGFVTYGLNEGVSITCVPCDSVKHLLK